MKCWNLCGLVLVFGFSLDLWATPKTKGLLSLWALEHKELCTMCSKLTCNSVLQDYSVFLLRGTIWDIRDPMQFGSMGIMTPDLSREVFWLHKLELVPGLNLAVEFNFICSSLSCLMHWWLPPYHLLSTYLFNDCFNEENASRRKQFLGKCKQWLYSLGEYQNLCLDIWRVRQSRGLV